MTSAPALMQPSRADGIRRARGYLTGRPLSTPLPSGSGASAWAAVPRARQAHAFGPAMHSCMRCASVIFPAVPAEVAAVPGLLAADEGFVASTMPSSSEFCPPWRCLVTNGEVCRPGHCVWWAPRDGIYAIIFSA